MITEIGIDDIEDLALGSAFLATGGGGDPFLGSQLCREALDQYGPVRLLDVSELADSDAVFCAAAIREQARTNEKPFSMVNQDRSVRTLERFISRKASAIMSLKIGGWNSMMPAAYAALRALPIVNADGMGRSLPQLQMTSFNIAGVKCTPMTLADENGNVAIFETGNAKMADELARTVTAVMGASSYMSCYPMTGAQVRTTSVRGTLSAATAIGQAVNGKRYEGQAPVSRLIAAVQDQALYKDARCAFEGKIESVDRVTLDGRITGTCTIKGLSDSRTATLSFHDENLCVAVGGELLCIVPDLIAVVDSETAHAIPTGRLAYGQRVSVIVCAAPLQLTSCEALAVVGPQVFGLEHSYASLATLISDWLSDAG